MHNGYSAEDTQEEQPVLWDTLHLKSQALTL